MNESASPVIEPKETIVEVKVGLGEALDAVLAGSKISRDSWPDEVSVSLQDRILTIKNETGLHSWIISEEDLKATDWEIL